jgi:phosphatidylglycerol:prolipoprotein diacylglycerol transferase
MDTNYVSFPNLGFGFDLNRVAFNVFGIEVYWYGIIIALGFTLAATFALLSRKKFGIKENDLIDALLFAVPISIIGARLYYVLFNLSYYKNIMDVISIRDGGLAIYGAVIAATITVFVFCRVRKVRLGDLLDLGALGLLIGQAIGRWGNFVNIEAYGSATNLPWAMEIYD